MQHEKDNATKDVEWAQEITKRTLIHDNESNYKEGNW